MTYFTRQEQRIVILLGIVLLLGTGLLLIKRFQPGVIMRISMGEPDFDIAKDEISPRLKDDSFKQGTGSDESDTDATTEFIGPPVPKQQLSAGSMPKPTEPSAQDQQPDEADRGNGADTIPRKTEQKGKININAATKEELETLPRIGPVMAQRIIDYRQKHDGFTNIRELTAVRGIGDATLQGFRDRITVEEHNGSE